MYYFIINTGTDSARKVETFGNESTLKWTHYFYRLSWLLSFCCFSNFD